MRHTDRDSTDATLLVVVRHGRTDWNATGRFLGRTDRPLDDEGHRQAQGLVPWRGVFDAVYASPLARAWQTAEVLAGEGVRREPALAELDHGELEGLRAEEAFARYPAFFEAWREAPESVTVPGGGALAAARDEALAALQSMVHRHPGQRVAVVSHQLVLASVLATLEGAPLARWADYKLPNVGCAALLGAPGGALRVARRTLSVGSRLPPIV